MTTKKRTYIPCPQCETDCDDYTLYEEMYCIECGFRWKYNYDESAIDRKEPVNIDLNDWTEVI